MFLLLPGIYTSKEDAAGDYAVFIRLFFSIASRTLHLH